MRYIPISMLEPGMMLGQDIVDGAGRMLLAKDLFLNQEYIKNLDEMGFPGAYINDQFSEGIEIVQVIQPEIKREALSIVNSLFIDKGAVASQKCIDDVVMKVVESMLDNSAIMCNLLDLKKYDDYTYFHSINVAVLAAMIGVSMNMSVDELEMLTTAAMLHDVGKRFIPIEILGVKRALTFEERKVIQEHPRQGCDFLKEHYTFSASVYGGVLEHHEWYDGTGYPLGTKEEDIPLFGRIIKLVDVYDALTSKRPYHEAQPPADAVEYLMAMNSVEFDPGVLSVFLKKVAVYPIGCQVELSTGQHAIVVENFSDFVLRPRIKLLSNGSSVNLRDDVAARCITIKRMIM